MSPHSAPGQGAPTLSCSAGDSEILPSIRTFKAHALRMSGKIATAPKMNVLPRRNGQN